MKFHGEVRVKEIEAKNRGLSAKLSGKISNDLRRSYQEVEHPVNEEDEGFSDGDDPEQYSDGSDDLNEEGNQNSSEAGERDAIERFKDDLFDDEDHDDDDQAGVLKFLSTFSLNLMTGIR